MAKISAQDTTPGHNFSTLDLIASITSKPLTELLFGAAVFSPLKVEVSSSSNDPSQPCFQTGTCYKSTSIVIVIDQLINN